jgi:hypothetical protein
VLLVSSRSFHGVEDGMGGTAIVVPAIDDISLLLSCHHWLQLLHVTTGHSLLPHAVNGGRGFYPGGEESGPLAQAGAALLQYEAPSPREPDMSVCVACLFAR